MSKALKPIFELVCREQHGLMQHLESWLTKPSLILKIVPQSLWLEVKAAGTFVGAPVDLADGFIHFSTPEQVAETAAKHFAGQGGLLLVAVDPKRLGAALRFEVSRGGALFPHLYAPLATADVAWAKPLPLGPDGRHDFTGLVP